MEEVILYISKAKLVKTSGVGWKDLLADLIHEGILNSYTECVKLCFDKEKALHIQSVLEFYESREAPSQPNKLSKKENE